MNKSRHTMAVAAHLLLRDADRRVLFMRRANTGYADGQWSVPAGHVESGETILAACIREAEEEIGIRLNAASTTAVLVQHKHDEDGQERIDAFFVAELQDGHHPGISEPDYCDAVQWCPIENPPKPLVPYVAAALHAITTRPSEFLAYFGFSKSDAG